MRNWILSLGLLAAAQPAVAALSPADRTMIATVDAERERTVAMLGKWVETNSGTMNPEGVTRVGAMLRSELEPLGFAVEWIDLAAVKRGGHIVARHRGKASGQRLLLIGHLDTVFERDNPFQHWRRDGDTGFGPGAGDDKGGMAVIIAALRAMDRAGTLKNANITVFLTGDEEDAGDPLTISRRDLIAEGRKADAALDFEGLASDNGLDVGSIARRSAGGWTVRITGKSGHSSGVGVSAGFGANYELARIVDAFRRDLPEPSLTYNVGVMGGGELLTADPDKTSLETSGKSNIIAAVAFAKGDLRALTPDQLDRTKAKMRAIVGQHLPGTSAEIVFADDYYPPMPPTAGNRALLAWLNSVNADLGLAAMGELDPAKRGAGDISFVAADVDGLIGLGGDSAGDHTPAESVDLPSIFKQAKRAAILMSRLAAEKRGPSRRK
ncbi:MAG: M20/M25/M40 family metallo-hydrolase [Sphingomicrobium sp.]